MCARHILLVIFLWLTFFRVSKCGRNRKVVKRKGKGLKLPLRQKGRVLPDKGVYNK